MKLIVGLGNPEDRYTDSRHNIGFMVIDGLAKQLVHQPEVRFTFNKEYKALVYQASLANQKVLLVKPQTYMNNSGWTVKLLADFHKVSLADIWIIHDDIDLPLGKIRIRLGGAGGGHRGIDSIIKELGSDRFVRFRLGIGRGKLDEKKSTAHNLHRRMVEKYVLSPFTKSEKGKARIMVKHAEKAVLSALANGLEAAMNRFK